MPERPAARRCMGVRGALHILLSAVRRRVSPRGRPAVRRAGAGAPPFQVLRTGVRRRIRTCRGLAVPVQPPGPAPDWVVVPALGEPGFGACLLDAMAQALPVGTLLLW